MRLVPKPVVTKLDFFRVRAERWAQDPEAIGTTPEMVADLAVKTQEAREALATQQLAQLAAQSATLRLKLALDAMEQVGGAIIGQVRVKARMTGEEVYPLAFIPAPASASPMGQPGTPTRFAFSIDSLGMLRLRWKCKNPRNSVGTIYEVYRRIGRDGELTFLGSTGQKRFVDRTIPVAGQIIYQVRAMRSTAIGEWATFNVSIGTSGSAPGMRVAA